MRNVFGTILVLSLAITFIPVTHATYCVSDGDNTGPAQHCCDTQGTIPISSPDGSTFYIDVRAHKEAGPAWLYQEANGVLNLQRGGIDRIGEKHVTVFDQDLPSFTGLPGSPTVQTVGGQDIAGKHAIGISDMTPTAVVYTEGTLPVVHTDGSQTYVSGGESPGIWVDQYGRYDSCHDLVPSAATDINVL